MWLGKLYDLDAARASLEATSNFAAWLAKKTGAKIISTRPGHIVAALPNDDLVEVKSRLVNVFHKEAEAYMSQGLPVPAQVQADIECWDREHGRH